MRLFIIGLLMSVSVLADESKYTPMCFEVKKKECERTYNIGYVGTGKGNLNGYEQAIYSFGYMRLIPTKGGDDLYLGLEINGSQRDSIFGWQAHIGLGF